VETTGKNWTYAMDLTDNFINSLLVCVGELGQCPADLTELNAELSLSVFGSNWANGNSELLLSVLRQLSGSFDQAIPSNQ
jgi:hypothetical protein